MEEWMSLIIQYLSEMIEVCGTIVIVYGAGRTIYTYLREQILRHRGLAASTLRLVFARHLALGLEFELAADILLTIIEPTWELLGLLAAIIVLRTALTFFLERELAAMEHTEASAVHLKNREL